MFVMSGWPRGAVDSMRCTGDVLPGSGLLLTCLLARYIKGEGWQSGMQVRQVRERGVRRLERRWQKEHA